MNSTCIKTVYYIQNDPNDSNNYKANLGVLSFPSAFYNSKCIPDSPVKYLYDKPKSFCNTAINQVRCQNKSKKYSKTKFLFYLNRTFVQAQLYLTPIATCIQH